MITQKEANAVERVFLDAEWNNGPVEYEERARLLWKGWKKFWRLLQRDKTYNSHTGIGTIDWQIGNWANDVCEVLYEEGKEKELIRVCTQILMMQWDDEIFHQNARSNMADAYERMGNLEMCYQLYHEYLEQDPLWSWGWIRYFRQLKKYEDPKFREVLNELYERIQNGEPFQFRDDLIYELVDEFTELGEMEKVEYLKTLPIKRNVNVDFDLLKQLL